MKIVVVGSSGTIGKAVSQLLKDKGHEITGVSRSTQPGVNITDGSSIDSFYAALGEVDAIICAAGGAMPGAFDKVTDEQVHFSINSKLLGQVNMVRKGLRKVRPGGVFIITG